VTAKQFRQTLDGVKSSKIVLNINSPGGDVFDGIAIYNDLLAHKASVVVRVTGLAASAASIIAMAGDEVHIAENAFFMIHNAWSVAVGDSRAMTKRANLLKKIDAELVETYAARTGGDTDEIRTQMDDETWLNADEAVEQGFADSTFAADEKADAKASFDLAPFRNVPKALKPRRMANKAKTEDKPKQAPPVEDFSSLVAALNDTNSRLAALISQV
jgi:ATP-dependent Clp protease protease subunit